MGRGSGGLIGTWAEAQRQQQRQYEEGLRRQARERREYEREQRARERDLARMHREQQAAYRARREADARGRTEEIEARVAELSGLLVAGCRAPAFRVAALRREESVAPFEPGPLAAPVPMPDPRAYVAQGGGWTAGARARAQRDAEDRYRRDWDTARLAEERRLRELADYRHRYETWAAGRNAEVRAHNANIQEMTSSLRGAEPETVIEYFSAALYANSVWPEGFPRQVSAAFDPAARQFVLNWQLPAADVVPEARSVRYVVSADQLKETARPQTQRRAVYRDVLAQSVLLALRDVFAADEFGVLSSVALNGFVDDFDPATGRRTELFVASVLAERGAFDGLRLETVNAADCLTDGLGGSLSAKPDQRVAVRPARLPEQVGAGVVSHGDGTEPDLLEMDPLAFEALVAELFRARGMQAVTTQRSGDGGVDVDAVDPDPISGGKIVVQVKRYRNTVPPSAVRDLYGTVQDAGANKGVLVTTSGFGPGSYTFANGKPLTLVSGPELVELLHQHGLRGRLGDGVPRGGSSGGGRSSGGARSSGGGPSSGGRSTGGSGGGAAPIGGTGSGGAGSGGSGGSAGFSSTAPTLVMPTGPDGPAAGHGRPADRTHGEDYGDPGDHGDFNVLGMSWSGAVALDVCALVCQGGRVLADDWFVFFNNPRTPDGSVRMLGDFAGDRAAVRVAFDAVPDRADRIVLVAAVDPAVNPDADLAGFTGAGIRLRAADGTELDRLEVSDGRAGESALVLGSFRRRAGGDWTFVVGGKGYGGGLGELVGDFGIDVQ
ncbi:restriction endonuclease [Streptomyces uncialis]|uniref:restriction endonuclease n=1 Tax=Streptomyces uncialis TaxID=1048205 RepID=UPI003869BA0C|nr:restriction endonuclease [Streptomyces uncialis]